MTPTLSRVTSGAAELAVFGPMCEALVEALPRGELVMAGTAHCPALDAS